MAVRSLKYILREWLLKGYEQKKDPYVIHCHDLTEATEEELELEDSSNYIIQTRGKEKGLQNLYYICQEADFFQQPCFPKPLLTEYNEGREGKEIILKMDHGI